MRVAINYLMRGDLGGAKTYLHTIVPEMTRHSEHQFLLLINKSVTDLPLFENATVRRVRTLPGWFLLRPVWEKFCMWNYIKDWKPDVIYAPAQFAATIRQCPTVLAMRNMLILASESKALPFRKRFRYFILRKLVAKCLTSADYVVAVSDFVREYLHNNLKIDADRIYTIPHGFNPLFRRIHSSEDLFVQGRSIPRPFVFAPGGYSGYQHPELIVEAFIMLSRQFRNLNLVMAGPAIPYYFRKWLSAKYDYKDVRTRIMCLENVSHCDMVLLFNQAELSCFASEIEACPNVLLEALACGTAILAPNNKPFPEFLKDAGITYKAKNCASLRAGMSRLLRDSVLRTLLKGKALKRSENYTAAECARRTIRMLETVATESKTP